MLRAALSRREGNWRECDSRLYPIATHGHLLPQVHTRDVRPVSGKRFWCISLLALTRFLVPSGGCSSTAASLMDVKATSVPGTDLDRVKLHVITTTTYQTRS